MLGSDPGLRPLVCDDLPRILELEAELFAPDDWSEGMYREEIEHPDRVYIARVLGDELIGWGGIWTGDRQAELLTIGVDSHHRRRGHARAILTELISVAVERGAREMFLEVRADDAGAQALYRGFGFQPLGLRRNYYQRSGADAIAMKARIGTS